MGRPREFDMDTALDKAMHVFWSQGYEGASLTDLTEAMGINRPSLYAAFGNKESLFRKVVERYCDGPAAHNRDALQEKTSRAVVEKLLRGVVDLLTKSAHPAGCLMVQGALACGEEGETAREELARSRQANTAAVRRRFERAKAEGDLPAAADPAALARYVTTVMYGLAVQAASGAKRTELMKVVELTLLGWAAPPKRRKSRSVIA